MTYMSLKDYRIPTLEVTGGLTVRGLSFTDISALARDHYESLAKIFDGVRVGEDIDVRAMVLRFAPTMPMLVVDIIARGCGEPDETEIVNLMSFGVQIEAVQKIGELTFAVEGGAKKVFQMVMAAMEKTTAVMTDQTP